MTTVQRFECKHDHEACEYRLFGRCLTCEAHAGEPCSEGWKLVITIVPETRRPSQQS